MGYNIKQKIEICLHSEANPLLTQLELAEWALKKYGLGQRPCQTTILRILSSKSSILSTKDTDMMLVRRRKQSNPLLRQILTEWVTQAQWQRIPITTPIIQLTANAIWNKLPSLAKEGNGVFSQKWCIHFIKKLNLNTVGSPQAVRKNFGYPLDKVWKLDEKLALKEYVNQLLRQENYVPQDLFVLDEFLLFYSLPLDQIFDVSSVLKGLSQSNKQSESSLTVLLGCNFDGLEKLSPLVVSDTEAPDMSSSTQAAFKAHTNLQGPALANKIQEVYLISYKTNKTKWITLAIFQDYLLSLDHKLEASSPERKIVIFLDDSSSHRIINIEFKHILLVFLENSSKHKNLNYGTKFDYLPMSFGIVEEFKILYRLQQYLEMINKQRNTKVNPDHTLYSQLMLTPSPDSAEILSESDYYIPLIKALEWIKRSWDSLSQETIFSAWRRSFLVSVREPWPLYDPLVQQNAAELFAELLAKEPNLSKSYEKLQEIMEYLNVVIPWEIDELLNLVNERTKVTLTYASIDEMINSCALTVEKEEPEPVPRKRAAKGETRQINAFQEKLPPMAAALPRIDDYSYKAKMNMDALIMATNSSMLPPIVPGLASQASSPAAIPGIALARLDSAKTRIELLNGYRMENSLLPMLKYETSQAEAMEPPVDVDLVSLLTKVLEASLNKRIKLSPFAVDELSTNLASIKQGTFLLRSTPGEL